VEPTVIHVLMLVPETATQTVVILNTASTTNPDVTVQIYIELTYFNLNKNNS